MVDNFLEEVEEGLRSDRYRTMARKALPWVLGIAALALVIALGAWAYQSWRQRDLNKASETYAAALETAQRGDMSRAYTQFGEVTELSDPAYKSLALIGQAAIRYQENKTEEAVALLDRAAKEAPHASIEDGARLKAIYMLMDTAPYASLDERIQPLLGEKRPYRMLAREALAMAKLQAGRTREAREDLTVLTLMPGVPENMRQRADAVIGLIDSGSAASLGAAVKAGAALPPPSPQANPAAPAPLPQQAAPQSGTPQ